MASPATAPGAHIAWPPKPPGATAALALEDGSVLWGRGAGAAGVVVGEVCFNTAMTGYQEILTDPSYAGQIITFTFPHIGNVGANDDDTESAAPAAEGCVLRADITAPSNFRAQRSLDDWLRARGVVAVTGVDTRALAQRIRDAGAPRGALAHNPEGVFDLSDLHARARGWPGLEGMDLARRVTRAQPEDWDGTCWTPGAGYGRLRTPRRHVVAVDYGMKDNIARCLATLDCRVTIVPARASAADILALRPDGVFLSNGPGDPAAMADYAPPMIRALLDSGVPIFGICLGHQLLALALGARTRKMALGHRGANHPIHDLTTGKVEIVSQNHGFVVDGDSLPSHVEPTHYSLFDGTLAGMRVKGGPVFSVQYHPEASPGPRDSHYLFQRFVDLMDARPAAA